MYKLLILIAFLFNFSQVSARIGENANFWIVAQDEYDRLVVKGQDVVMRRYIVVPSMNKDYKTILQTEDEELLLAKFAYLLKSNRTASDSTRDSLEKDIVVNRIKFIKYR